MDVLVTGAIGQIGTELVRALRQRHGAEHVLSSAHLERPLGAEWEPYVRLDVTDAAAVEAVVASVRPRLVYHLAAILSATGERDPLAAWRVNMDGLLHVLDAARRHGVAQVFFPSSIAVFGPDVPKVDTPQDVRLRPATMYGITKVAGELLADFYALRHGVDVRGLRYPGVISSEQLPGGGTTDYAVEMFYAAVRDEPYTCFVREDTALPMIYMPDCIRAALELMEADPQRLVHRNAYNLTAMSFTAGELAAEIRRHVPGFRCEYRPDSRQLIADGWPRSIDDSAARAEWGWRPQYQLSEMVTDMLTRLRARLAAESRMARGASA